MENNENNKVENNENNEAERVQNGDWYRPSLKVDVFFRLLFRQFNFMQF